MKIMGRPSATAKENARTIPFFSATNLVAADNKISFNCAVVYIRIARMFDTIRKVAFCKTTGEVSCISNTKHELTLTKNFDYFDYTDEIVNPNILYDTAKARPLFFSEMKNVNTHFFRISVNTNKEVVAVDKIRTD